MSVLVKVTDAPQAGTIGILFPKSLAKPAEPAPAESIIVSALYSFDSTLTAVTFPLHLVNPKTFDLIRLAPRESIAFFRIS